MIDFNSIRFVKGHDGSVAASLCVSAHFTHVEDPESEEFKSYVRSMIWLKLYQEKKLNLIGPVLQAVSHCNDREIGQRLLETFHKEFEVMT